MIKGLRPKFVAMFFLSSRNTVRLSFVLGKFLRIEPICQRDFLQHFVAILHFLSSPILRIILSGYAERYVKNSIKNLVAAGAF